MKIRRGFVSNSSSASFCIYGVCVGAKSWDEQEQLEELLSDTDLEIHGPEYRHTYIGRSWKRIKDNETGAQFKEGVRQVLERYELLDKKELGTHQEAWRDG
jgi:hypothetical protein